MKLLSSNRHARYVTTVIIGAGHAGLAISRCLTERSIDHILLERGEVANSWRHERWDSLRLLTPNWQTRLPDFHYQGNDADGFMSMPEVVDFITGYARATQAPVYTQTKVTAVYPHDEGYLLETTRGAWICKTFVIASGACNIANVPASSAALPAAVDTLTPHEYRNPDQLADGGVLVVGAAATGLQIADEVQRSGRPVTLAVGEHVRMPRTYRGKDILYWMETTGLFDEGYDQVDDVNRVRRLPSPQLIGSPDRFSLDLNHLTRKGVKLVGRFSGIHSNSAIFSGGLANTVKLADLKMNRLLRSIDSWIDEQGGLEANRPEEFEPTALDGSPILDIDLNSGQIKTVIWATGFRPDYSWLKIPVLDAKGRLRHSGGVVDAPGVYVMGLPFLRRRKSSFIHGAEDDARDLADHLALYLGSAGRPRMSAAC